MRSPGGGVTALRARGTEPGREGRQEGSGRGSGGGGSDRGDREVSDWPRAPRDGLQNTTRFGEPEREAGALGPPVRFGELP